MLKWLRETNIVSIVHYQMQLLDDMMSQSESPYDWCLRLGQFKQQAASQQLDALFRLLFIAAGKSTDASPGREGQQHAFALRIHAMRYHAAYLRMSDAKDPGIIWDKIMRCGVEYDRSTRTGQTQEDALSIVRAYKDIYEFVKGVSAVDRSDAHFQKWHSHFLFFSSKVCVTTLQTFRNGNLHFSFYAHDV